MYYPFESISPSARIWVYQSKRKLTQEEERLANEILNSFTEEWAAHGQPLKGSFDIRFSQFLILAVDESYNTASGCSIDESVRVFKELENRVGTQLFDRHEVAFKTGDDISLISLGDLKQKFAEGVWNETTPTFNNLVSFKSQLEQEWIVPAGNTWLKRYVSSIKVAP